MRFAHFMTLFYVFFFCCSCLADSVHPQDGPHADLRVAIEDNLVRYSVGVNLAFLDETIDISREALNELSPEESEQVLEVFRDYLIEHAPCVINGTQVEPVFERLEMFTHPDPGMLAIFPKMGARALIRATVVMRFDAPEFVETVDVTWPAYPFDLLAEEMELASATPARMYFEVVLTANGKSKPAEFTHAEPTLSWSRSIADAPDPLSTLPEPAVAQASSNTLINGVLFFGALFALTGYLLVPMKNKIASRSLGMILICILVGIVVQLTVAHRFRPAPPPVLADAESKVVLRTLHESMYRAFDYTSESDIYDRLAFALQGDLLGELYEQIRLSLLQAEEEMKVGVVTGLEPIETVILEMDEAGGSAQGLGFLAKHRWRVDGTVYHWGHSHTRAHIYEAHYRVTFTEDGWKFTEHELRSQQRIDPADGSPMDAADSIQEKLEDLGFPDL